MDKSLLRPVRATDEPRLAMLETVHEYALEQLEARGEATAMRRRHAAYYLTTVEEAGTHLTGQGQATWLARLEREHDNIRAVLEWVRRTTAGGGQDDTHSEEAATGETGLRLAAVLWRFWWLRGHLSEGRDWIRALLERSPGAAPGLRARALNAAGNLAWAQGDLAQATALQQQSLELWRELGDTLGVARSLNNLGLVARDQEEYRHAARLYEESLALHRQAGNTRGIAGVLVNLGEVVHQQGDYGQATALFEDSLALYRQLEDTRGIADTLHNLGNATYDHGAPERAEALLVEALQGYQGIGDLPDVAAGLEDLAAVAASMGHTERAARLCGAATALRTTLGIPVPPARQARVEGTVAQARAALAAACLDGRDRFAHAWAAGMAMTPEDAIADALGTVCGNHGRSKAAIQATCDNGVKDTHL